MDNLCSLAGGNSGVVSMGRFGGLSLVSGVGGVVAFDDGVAKDDAVVVSGGGGAAAVGGGAAVDVSVGGGGAADVGGS